MNTKWAPDILVSMFYNSNIIIIIIIINLSIC